MHHHDLSSLDTRSIDYELTNSRASLRSITGRPVTLLALPYGDYNEVVIARCRDAGYERVFTSAPFLVREGEDPFVVGRVGVTANDWAWEFRLKLLGAYRWVPRASAVKQRLTRQIAGLYAAAAGWQPPILRPRGWSMTGRSRGGVVAVGGVEVSVADAADLLDEQVDRFGWSVRRAPGGVENQELGILPSRNFEGRP